MKPSWVENDHADDLPYVFGWILGEKPGQGVVPTKRDIELSEKCIKIWCDFARTGRCPWKPYQDVQDIEILR